MNYTNKHHKLTSTAYEGFGVYEFGVPGHWYTPQQGMAQFPGMPTGMPSAEEAITTEGGIQVIKGEYRDMSVGMLDQTTFNFDGPDQNAPMVTGQASVILGTIGSGWASDYLAKGYAIMADIATIQGGTPTIMMSKVAADIAANAGAGGRYVVIAAPGPLLGSAQVLAAGPLPSTQGPGLPPPAPAPGNGEAPAQAGAATPAWMWPAVIGVGALAIWAVVVASKRKK